METIPIVGLADPRLLPLLVMIVGALPTLALGFRFRRISGKSPVVLDFGDTVGGLQSKLFRFILAATMLLLAANAWWPASLDHIAGRIPLLETHSFLVIGLALILLGAVVVTLAEWQMGRAWRIGIPVGQDDPLVRHGLYLLSRNPIYLGLVTAYIGLLLAAPNAISALLLGTLWISLSTQIRLEEAHLAGTLGTSYDEYRRRVRRWL